MELDHAGDKYLGKKNDTTPTTAAYADNNRPCLSNTDGTENTMSLQNVLLTIPVSHSSLDTLKNKFNKVVYCPPPSLSSGNSSTDNQQDHGGSIREALPGVQVLIASAKDLALLPCENTDALNSLRLVQLASAGVDTAVETGWMKRLVESGRVVKSQGEWLDRQRQLEIAEHEKAEQGGNGGSAKPPIAFTNASGIHVRSISQYCVATLLSLYHALDQQIVWARTKKTWAAEEDFVQEGEVGYGVRTVYGKTVGMLGYGHIGRETARLFQVFGVNVIAATSSGAARPDDGYILPGTGDKEGAIPSEYYQTTDRASFHAFLARSDILICSVPSTNATRGLLGGEELRLLPDGAVVINVGRGDLIDTYALLEALDNNIAGAALDVTNPEPLPTNHPLFSHPRCIITPHLSGTVENEHNEVVKLCLSSVERMRKGEAPWGIVDVEKGY